jgi:hypothetical protein
MQSRINNKLQKISSNFLLVFEVLLKFQLFPPPFPSPNPKVPFSNICLYAMQWEIVSWVPFTAWTSAVSVDITKNLLTVLLDNKLPELCNNELKVEPDGVIRNFRVMEYRYPIWGIS